MITKPGQQPQGKPTTVAALMHQGAGPTSATCPESVAGLMKQSGGKKHTNAGRTSIKAMMKQ